MTAYKLDVRLKKIAKMVHLGVSQGDIASVMGISEEGILQLISSGEFQGQLAQVKNTEITKVDNLNQGWDCVEERALGQILENLQNFPDPEFALRAATVANKAQRRGGKYQNEPLAPTINMQAIVNLSPQFVKSKEGNFVVRDRAATLDLKKKETDMLELSKVQVLLETKSMSRERTDVEQCIDAVFKQVL